YAPVFFFFQAEDGIRDRNVTGVQTCALPISDKPIIWIDALDTGLVNFLRASFREEWSEGMNQLPTKKDGASRRLYGPARQTAVRSEERRVGKEGRCRRWWEE